jgi:hypothetical protein
MGTGTSSPKAAASPWYSFLKVMVVRPSWRTMAISLARLYSSSDTPPT